MINAQIYSISNDRFVPFYKVMVDFNFQMDMHLSKCVLISTFCILLACALLNFSKAGMHWECFFVIPYGLEFFLCL